MSGMLYDPKEHPELHEIRWKRVGTPDLEATQSVFRRLAFSHHVTPGVLFNSYFKPTLQNSGLKGSGVPIALASQTFSVAADSLTLKTIVERLEVLTGEVLARVASLLQLCALLASGGLACRVPQLCFRCFEDDIADFFCLEAAVKADALFGRVLWAFKAVTACPAHGLRLEPASCGAPSDLWAKGPRTVQLCGVCPRCGSIGMRCQRVEQKIASEREIWSAAQVGSLIAFASDGGEISAVSLRDGIRQCTERVGKWSRQRAIESGMTFDLIRGWLAGRNRPSLQGLLALAAYSQTTLVKIVSGAVGSDFVLGPAVWYETLRPKGRGLSSTEVAKGYRKLSDGGRIAISGECLSRHLGVSPAYLWEKHFPVWEQCQRVRSDHRQIQAQARQDELDSLVRHRLR